jgi:hypothetical protein
VAVCVEVLDKFGMCGVILKGSFVFAKAGVEIAPSVRRMLYGSHCMLVCKFPIVCICLVCGFFGIGASVLCCLCGMLFGGWCL